MSSYHYFLNSKTSRKTGLHHSFRPCVASSPQFVSHGFPLIPDKWSSRSQHSGCAKCPLCRVWCNWQLSPLKTSFLYPFLFLVKPYSRGFIPVSWRISFQYSLLALVFCFPLLKMDVATQRAFYLNAPFSFFSCDAWSENLFIPKPETVE